MYRCIIDAMESCCVVIISVLVHCFSGSCYFVYLECYSCLNISFYFCDTIYLEFYVILEMAFECVRPPIVNT